MNRALRKHDRARGQILVVFVLMLFVIIGGVAIVIDGGNALGQQRATQNGADAAAEAGTTVIAQYLMGGSASIAVTGTCPTATTDPWDLVVCKAVYGSAGKNGVTITSASYVNYKGDLLTAVGSGQLPAGAQGVVATAARTFNTYFASVAGMNTITTTTSATAATGTITTLCVPNAPCALFPMTIPVKVDTCAGDGKLTPGTGDWPYLGDAQTNAGNEAIVPICKNQNDDLGGGSSGSVGWLDFSSALGATTTGTCPKSFSSAITAPCIASLTFPTWVQTFTGGVGKGGPAIEDTLNTLHGDVVQIPLFDGTCKIQPSGVAKSDCPPDEIGVGVNTWYHIPSFASFKLDAFYISGGDKKQCDELPGQPFVDGNGSNGCLKGWWVIALPTPGAIQLGPVSPSTSNQLGVQLIR